MLYSLNVKEETSISGVFQEYARLGMEIPVQNGGMPSQESDSNHNIRVDSTNGLFFHNSYEVNLS